jgi:rfaE bifunctional protein nucleotidyltransferase chain/domain
MSSDDTSRFDLSEVDRAEIIPLGRLPESSCHRETPPHCNGEASGTGKNSSEVTLRLGEIGAELGSGTAAAERKILPIDQVEAHVRRLRQAGRHVVMTNGCFDLLHPGHVACLQEARRYGDCLLVGLNSDRSVRELKGAGRPIMNQQDRAEMLAALACVDCVVIFDETSVAGLVQRVLPDVLVKGGQYAVEEIVGHQIVARYGGRVVPLVMKASFSTTALIEKIRNLPFCKRSAA